MEAHRVSRDASGPGLRPRSVDELAEVEERSHLSLKSIEHGEAHHDEQRSQQTNRSSLHAHHRRPSDERLMARRFRNAG